MWSTAAKSIGAELEFVRGTEYGGYTVDPQTGKFDGILGWLQNATVDGICEDFTYRSSRMKHFYSTVPIDWTIENFYERADPSTFGSLESFVVFPPLLLYMFVTSALLVIFVERLLYVFRHRIRTEYLMKTSASVILVNSVLGQQVPVFSGRRWMADAGKGLASLARDFLFLPPALTINIFEGKRRTLSFCIYLVAILSIVIIGSATFAGIASATNSEPPTTLRQLVSDLQSGSKTLLVQNAALVKPATELEMFGRDVQNDFKRFRAIPEIQNQVDLLCSSDQFVSFVTLFQTFSYRPDAPLKFPCALQIVDTTDYSAFPATTAIGQDAFGKLSPVTFYFGKQLGGKFRRWFDQIILRLFNERMMVDIWWRKYTNRPRRDTTILPKHTFNPVPLRAFNIPNIVCGCLMGLGVVILGLELLHKRFFSKSETIRKLTTILSSFTPECRVSHRTTQSVSDEEQYSSQSGLPPLDSSEERTAF